MYNTVTHTFIIYLLSTDSWVKVRHMYSNCWRCW